MAAALSTIQKKYASLQRSQAMSRIKKRGEDLQHTMVAAGAGYAMGTIERNSTTPLPTIFGLDPKLSWGAFFAVIATSLSGKMGRACNAISDGLLSAYGYSQGLGSGYTIKGVEDGSADDFDL